MLWRTLRMLLVVIVVVGLSSGAVRSQSEVMQVNAPLGNTITYQGWLQQSGVVVEGVCDLRFALFSAATAGTQVGSTLDRPSHTVTGGYFTVSDLDFGAVFTGEARWIEVAVRCPAGSGDFTTLAPRQPLTPAPYALYAVNNWSLLGNAGTNTPNFIGTTDPVTLTLKVSNTVALRLLPNAISPSIVGGIRDNAVTAGVVGATIAGGGGPDGGPSLANRVTDSYGVIGGGIGNQAGDNTGTTTDSTFATVGGGRTNLAGGLFATISGGQANTASNTYATISGGVENYALGIGATVGGGQTNNAAGESATVSGGIENVATVLNATVSGGASNEATGENATISGGFDNLASFLNATVSGGSTNQAIGNEATVGGGSNNVAEVGATVAGGSSNQAGAAATVGGGSSNEATELYATVGGGVDNNAFGQYSFVGGGTTNTAQGHRSTVSGGGSNVAGADETTVGGGFENQANGNRSTVSGGSNNIATGGDSTISGGDDNQVLGSAATIGGGRFNRANSDFSTISGGVDAYASHHGEWAYSAGGFATAQSGEAQTSLYVLRGTTAGATTAILALNDFGDRLTLAEDRTVVFDIQIAARSAGGESAGYTVRGVIENQLGTTALIGLATTTLLGEDVAAWGVTVTADDTNDSLKITVTGGAGNSVRWVATVRTTEVQSQ